MMTYISKTNSLVFLYIFLNFVSLSQAQDSVKLLGIIAMGTGDDIRMWCGWEETLLKIDDSILIRFNESSTYEDRLVLDDPIYISNQKCEVILNILDGNNQVRTFTKDSISNKGYVIVRFDTRRCCDNKNEKLVFFSKDSLRIVDTFCSDRDSIMSFVNKSDDVIELIGVQYASTSENLILQRIQFLEDFLVMNGIKKDRIVQSTISSFYKSTDSYWRGRKEYIDVYPENYENEEAAVIIKVSENTDK